MRFRPQLLFQMILSFGAGWILYIASNDFTRDHRLVTRANTTRVVMGGLGKETRKEISTESSIVKNIYPVTTDSPYLLNNPDICNNVSKIDILIVLHTAMDHKERRNMIRQTWGDPHLVNHVTTRLVFFLGISHNKKVMASVADESKEYKDMVQSSFVDHYHNLTNKGVLVYRWIAEFCNNNVVMVLKSDDDMFIDIPRVVTSVLPKMQKRNRTMCCQVRWKNTSPVKRTGKWAVSDDQFVNKSSYPVHYCNGFFLTMTPDIVKPMFMAARSTPFFWVDDVYLYGLLPNAIGNVSFINQIAITPARRKIECTQKSCERKGLIAFGTLKDINLEKTWLAGRLA